MRFRIALAAALAVDAAPLGHRVGVLPMNAAAALLAAGVLISLVSLARRVIATIRSREAGFGDRQAVAAGALSVGALVVPLASILPALGAPPIHDVTTDPDDPPRFEAVVPLRGAAPNSLEYGGSQLAAAQRAAYPDLMPLAVDSPPRTALEAARSVAAELDWETVAVDPARGMLEATATTFWFGFEDDVAVRVRPAESGGAVVDVRSVSRVGVGDLGANANRIRAFLMRLQAALAR